ncbi:hypothetical protein ACHAWC_008670 [Mediolabrus comicus]
MCGGHLILPSRWVVVTVVAAVAVGNDPHVYWHFHCQLPCMMSIWHLINEKLCSQKKHLL